MCINKYRLSRIIKLQLSKDSVALQLSIFSVARLAQINELRNYVMQIYIPYEVSHRNT